MEREIVTQETKDKILELFEAQDKIIEEQSEYINELQGRVKLAEKVCRAANNYVRNCNSPVATGWEEMLAALRKWRNEEQQIGEWVHGCTNGAGTEYCCCSVCGEDALKDKYGYTEFSDYCPNCGTELGNSL